MEYEIKLPEGQKFRIKGPEGFTQEQAWKELQGHLGQTKDQDPELLGYNLHPEEQGAAGGIYKRAGEQFFPSAARDISETASGLWNIISNPKGAWNALKEQAQSEEGIGGAIWNDISRTHYLRSLPPLPVKRVAPSPHRLPPRSALRATWGKPAGKQLAGFVPASVRQQRPQGQRQHLSVLLVRRSVPPAGGRGTSRRLPLWGQRPGFLPAA